MKVNCYYFRGKCILEYADYFNEPRASSGILPLYICKQIAVDFLRGGIKRLLLIFKFCFIKYRRKCVLYSVFWEDNKISLFRKGLTASVLSPQFSLWGAVCYRCQLPGPVCRGVVPIVMSPKQLLCLTFRTTYLGSFFCVPQ